MQRVLLDLLCDLVIRSRGVISDFSYPPYIVKMLDLMGKMVEGRGSLNPHIDEVIEELEDDNLRNRMDNNLRDQDLVAIGLPPIPRLHNYAGLKPRAHKSHLCAWRNTENLPGILWIFTCSSSQRCWKG